MSDEERTESAIQESNEGHSALMDFVDRFGQVLEFQALSQKITEFLENEGG